MSLGALLLVSCAYGTDVERQTQPVIQGDPVDSSVFPAAGALVVQGMFFCSGTLVTPTAVLTASHCLDPRFLGPQVPGFTFLADARTVQPGDVHAGSMAIVHPEFDLGGPGMVHDIGLLILAEPVVGVEPIPIASPSDTAGLTVGATVDLVGYGLTSPGGFEAGVRHHGRATLTSADALLYGIGTPGGVQNCNGDSGGPAFWERAPGDWVVVGVVTGGPEPCTMGGFDIRVDAHYDWLRASMGDPPSCDPPHTLCGLDCVDLSSDPFFCGSCERGCLSDELCQAGRCVPEMVVTPDAGPPAEADAGFSDDGGVATDAGPGPERDDGCTCRVGASSRRPPVGLALLFFALVLRRRRDRG